MTTKIQKSEIVGYVRTLLNVGIVSIRDIQRRLLSDFNIPLSVGSVWSYRLLALKYNGERIAETTENHPEGKVIHNRSNDTSKPLISTTNNLNKDGAVKKKCSGCHGSGYKIPSLQEIYEKKKAKSSKYD